MRYYNLQIFNKDEVIYDFTSLIQGNTVNSYKGQTTNPNALNVEFDIPLFNASAPTQNAYVRVYGIPLKDLSQSANLNGQTAKFYGGMWKGLPLANPKQSGLIVTGTVLQAFGNWQGTNQTLDIYFSPSSYSYGDIKNIVLSTTINQDFASAIKTALRTAYPLAKITVDISDKLIFTQDIQAYYQNIFEFAENMNEMSKSIIKNNKYIGVQITFPSGNLSNGEILVYDTIYAPPKKTIAFFDLIGQPTWLKPFIISLKTVLRADLQVGDIISLPRALSGYSVTTPQNQSRYRDNSIFQGDFQIQTLRHMGNFRQKDANSWVTVIEAFPHITYTELDL